ncbi:MAG: hypothetical protein IKM20_06045 [Erysipelotrichales bacterium]|nr:hypothetical protein [Erysipelotrichales bacterium]
MSTKYIEAIIICEELETVLDEALKELKKASNWGIVDLLGGGFITSLIKRDKLKNTSNKLYRIKRLLNDLAEEMNTYSTDFGLDFEIDDLIGVTDIWVDNFFSDFAMQAKIEKTYNTLVDIYNENQRLLKRLKNM